MQYNSLPSLHKPYFHIPKPKQRTKKPKIKCKTSNNQDETFSEYVHRKQLELENLMNPRSNNGSKQKDPIHLPKIMYDKFESPYLAQAISKARFPTEQKENFVLSTHQTHCKEFEDQAKDYASKLDILIPSLHKKFHLNSQRKLTNYRQSPSTKMFTQII